ncbi:MAG: right-handed parallel beta-helix repeat-containing protein, partial [Promethearchaeota archaeon]
RGTCSYNKILNNIINDTSDYGIYITTFEGTCDYNDIWHNSINNHKTGIYIYKSNADQGSCNYNNVWNNTVNNNSLRGIQLYALKGYCNNNTIRENIANNNTENGIVCEAYLGARCDYNEIKGNSAQENSQNGIKLSNSDDNIILDNQLTENNLYGLLIETNTYDNTIYNNSFIGNTINALDSGTGNDWDYGLLGNFWDDYGGVDVNDNGIGDTPYDVPPAGGSVDNYPIWDDGDDLIPNIIINSPSMNDAFGFNAPNFEISINDASPINSAWYTVDGGTTNYTFSGLTGTVNQTAWDNKGTEIMTLRFYANDSFGNLGFEDVTIWKDLVAPQITIISPTASQLCGVDAPTFSLTIVEQNIQTKRYSLNGRPNITFTTETQFSQLEWDFIGNGTVTLTFYVIDKAGNINSSEVIVLKDAYLPDIIIHSPTPDQIFGNTSPEFNISVIEEGIFGTYYSIDGIIGSFPFSGLTGSIDQDAWNYLSEGDITITFWAVDEAMNFGNESITVKKSTPSPPGIPGYNSFFMMGILAVGIFLIIKIKNLTKRLY